MSIVLAIPVSKSSLIAFSNIYDCTKIAGPTVFTIGWLQPRRRRAAPARCGHLHVSIHAVFANNFSRNDVHKVRRCVAHGALYRYLFKRFVKQNIHVDILHCALNKITRKRQV